MVYRGQSALHCGILVAFTQLIPEHQVQLFGVLKVRVKVGNYILGLLGWIVTKPPRRFLWHT
jgi:hypothetical protein